MKHLFLAAAVLLACGGCALFCDVAEFEELDKPQVCFKSFQEGPALHVEGRIRRPDGQVVESVRQVKDGGDIHIEVLVSPFERDDTGTGFATDVFLEGVDRITFGNKKTLLWRRHPEGENLPSKDKPVYKREEFIL